MGICQRGLGGVKSFGWMLCFFLNGFEGFCFFVLFWVFGFCFWFFVLAFVFFVFGFDLFAFPWGRGLICSLLD